jgi:hypothetical protein
MGGFAMLRYALIYGLISGFVIAATISASLALLSGTEFAHSLWFGYLVMLVALSFIFVGVKRYRDVDRGGVIKFFPAFGVGLAIAVVAGITYVLTWETYLSVSGYQFIEEFIPSYVRDEQAAGTSAAEIAANVQWMRDVYASPIQRMAMTFMEIFPVGLLIALVSAALLRNPRLLPASTREA